MALRLCAITEYDNNSKYDSNDDFWSNKTYEGRLKTFEKNWNNNNIKKEELAKAGFYFLGPEDLVRCAFCGVEGYKWVSGDCPMDDHKKWANDQGITCPFLRESTNNEEAASTSSNRQQDTCGKFGVEVTPVQVPENSLEKLGIISKKGPSYSEYVSEDSRLKSFKNWPKSIKQKPLALSQAGFFYTGVGDQVLCFHCGGGLKDWEEKDDPWEQHALWFSKCSYLLLKKGHDFVAKIKQLKEPKDKEEPSTSKPETIDETTSESATDPEKPREEEESSTKNLCKICYKNDLGVVFLPCGHIVACVDCASALNICAVCRKPLEASIRAFLS